MEAIWEDGRLRESFRSDIETLVQEAGGELELTDNSMLVCSFDPTAERSSMRVSFYYASGRQTVRFETIREEIELAMVNYYEINNGKVVIGSEKGSRTFRLDPANGEYSISKSSV